MYMSVNRAVWRKISFSVVLGQGVKTHITEPGAQSLLSLIKKEEDPDLLLQGLRANRHLPSQVYPTLCKVDTATGSERIPALVEVAKMQELPFPTFNGEFGGRIVDFRCLGNSYEADARGLFPLSPTLRAVPEEVLSDPIKLIDWLSSRISTISKECGYAETYSYVYLVECLIVRGVLPNKRKFWSYASGMDLYVKSPTLSGVLDETLEDLTELIEWLSENKDSIEKEISSTEGVNINTLIVALQAAGRVPCDQFINRFYGAREIYKNSPTIRAIPKETLEDPVVLINWLRKNREIIVAESGVQSAALATLVLALQSVNIIPINTQLYHRLANGRELFDRSDTLQKVPKKLLKNPIKLVNWLYSNRSQIVQEAGRGTTISVSSLVFAFLGAKLIPLEQKYTRLSYARDLYDLTPTLQAVPQDVLGDPVLLVNWNHANREQISKEAGRKETLSLVTLTEALQAAEIIPHEARYTMLASAREYYDSCPALWEGPSKWQNVQEIVFFLDRKREELVGKLDEKERISYSYAVQALEAAQRIGPDVNLRILRQDAAAADYARRFEDDIRENLFEAAKTFLQAKPTIDFNPEGTTNAWRRNIDRNRFMGLKDPTKRLSNPYINVIIRYALWLYGTQYIKEQLSL